MTEVKTGTIKLTEYSHGAGCGCKISPAVLTDILKSNGQDFTDPRLLIGNDTRDDAAVYDLDGENVIISTTDFFMPIVDDPFQFGGIASVNAMSDIWAMGGTPIMAIAVLGWPVNELPAEVANKVLEGARNACKKAGIALAGGHSIDSPEPIFGLAVTGTGKKANIKANAHATEGCELYLTKPLGIGILTTAQKKGLLKEEDLQTVIDLMLQLNDVGAQLSHLEGVKAMTDVTGFGLLGHLVELCEGSGLSAEIEHDKVPQLECLPAYLKQKTFPGGSTRNFDSYGHKVSPLSDEQKALLCDPQTSGGLLVAVDIAGRNEFLDAMTTAGLHPEPFGRITAKGKYTVTVH